MKKVISLLITVVMMVSILSSCGAPSTGTPSSGAAAVSTSSADKTLNIGIASEISNIVPMSNNVAVANRDGLIVFALYDPLIWYDTKTNTLSPWIATEWSHNDDGTEWYFTIRDDVYFHNGEKMTTEDVAWSLNLIPANPVVLLCAVALLAGSLYCFCYRHIAETHIIR